MKEELLLHIYFSDNFREIDISKFPYPLITVGGGNRDSIPLEGSSLAERHVSLEKEDDGIWINSYGGSVFQNGVKIGRKRIASGDVFILEGEKGKTAFMVKDRTDFPEPSTAYELNSTNTITIGRGNENVIIINDRLVSENHAGIYLKNGYYYIRDNGSTNGVYVNGKKTGEKILNAGDIITICGNKIKYTGESILLAVGNDQVRVKGLKPLKKNKPAYPFLHRPPRIMPDMPEGEIVIQSPPQAGAKPAVNWLVMLLPSAGMLLGTMMLVLPNNNGSNNSWLYLVVTLVSMFATILTYTSQIGKSKKDEESRKENYCKYLDQKNTEIKKLYELQKSALLRTYRGFNGCLETVLKREHYLWERMPGHIDFLSVGLGMGKVPFSVALKISDTHQVFGNEDELVKKATGLIDYYKELSDVPVGFSLLGNVTIGVTGEREAVLNFSRNMAVSLATTHSYDELKMGVVCPAEEYEKWSWMRWLPHLWDDGMQQRYFAKDRKGTQMMFYSLLELIKARDAVVKNNESGMKNNNIPIYILFIADSEMIRNELLLRYLVQNRAELGIITFFMFDRYENLPKDCGCIINVSGVKGEVLFKDGKREGLRFETEKVGIGEAERFSRALSPIRLSNLTASQTLPKIVTLFEMLGIEKTNELDIISKWKLSEPYISLTAQVGMGFGGVRFHLDLHEKAHGPHGLVAGTTGSGKSEFLQTLILSLALNYHPHELSFILIDYKGGGMANLFRQLPHVCGIITNLGGNQTNRALASIRGEVQRRQALFDKTGVNHIDKYQRLVRKGGMIESMPHLIIIIDEFAELKDEKPEFISELVSTARVGRSYGIHLILATQKPSGVVDSQIWSNARFRVCLKVQNTEDSKEMLKRPDAAMITIPGRAYLQVGNDEVFELFQSAWSGAEYHESNANDLESIKEVELDGSRQPLDRSIFKNDKKEHSTELSYVVDLICAEAEKAGIAKINGPWLPPLPERLYLPSIMADAVTDCARNSAAGDKYWACAFIGLADNPSAQAQYPLMLNFANEGHVVILGAPSSGKTTLLKTLAVSLALTNSPEDAWFYMLDFGGRTLGVFDEMPHTGAVIKPEDDEKIKNFTKLIIKELESRKRLFAEIGAAGIQAYRSRERKIPAIFILIDNFAGLMDTYPEMEEQLVQISREGGSLGVYMAITANSASTVRYKIMSNVKRILALQLTDRSEYVGLIGKGAVEPTNIPGRGLFKAETPLEFQTAFPAQGTSEVEQSMQIKNLCSRMRAEWKGKTAQKVPVVPQVLTLKELMAFCEADQPADAARHLPVGINMETVGPVYFNLEAGSHLLISAHSRSTGVTCLKGIAQILSDYPAENERSIYIIDSSSKDLKHISTGNQIKCCASGRSEIEEMLSLLNSPIIDTAEQFIIVCDYKDLVGKINQNYKDMIEKLIRNESGKNIHFIMAGTTADLGSCWDGPGKAMKDAGVGILLSEPGEQQIFSIRLPYNITSKLLKADEGYFIDNSGATRIKLPKV